MKNLSKFAGIIGQVMGAVFGDGVDTAESNTFKRFPHLSYFS